MTIAEELEDTREFTTEEVADLRRRLDRGPHTTQVSGPPRLPRWQDGGRAGTQ